MSDLQKTRVEAFKRAWHKADEEGDSGNRVARGLAAADAVVTVEQIAEVLFEEANGFAMINEYEDTREWSSAFYRQAEAVLALLRGKEG